MLTEQQDRQDGADKGRGSKIGAGARRPEVAQRENEEHQTDPIAKEADGGGGTGLCEARKRRPTREA